MYMNSSWNPLLSLPRTHVSFVQRVIGFKIKLRPFVMPILPIKKQLSWCQGSIFHSWIPPYKMSIVSRVIGSTTCIGNPSPLHHLRIGFRCMPLCWGRETSSINHEKGELNMYIIVTVNVVYADISTIEDWVGVWEAKCCLVIQLWHTECSSNNFVCQDSSELIGNSF